MQQTSIESPRVARQPRSTFSKLAGAGFGGAALMSGLIALVTGFPNNTALLILTAVLLVCAGLTLTPFRWMPMVLTVLGGVFLFQIASEPYVAYHLTNPKTGGFLDFVLNVLLTALVFVACAASIGASVQNYRPGAADAPGWLLAALTGVAGAVIGAILIGAIAQPGAAASTNSTNGVPTVHMSAANFDQASVMIGKDARLLLVDDVAVPHYIANGSWENGVAHPAKEPGAPTVNNVQVNGGASVEIGPFSSTGTYQLYCTIHPGMNLSVVVQ